MSKKLDIDMDLVKKMYLDERKTAREIASILGVNVDLLNKRIQGEGIKKPVELINRNESKVDADLLRKMYVDEDKSIREVAEFFGMSQSGMEKRLKALGIKKPQNWAPRKSIDDFSEEWLREKYLKENLTLDQLSKETGIPKRTLITGLAALDIRKPKELSVENVRKTCQERYGCWASQRPETTEKMRQTNLERYGVEFTQQREDIQQKSRDTRKQNYGYEFPMQIPEVKDKRKQNWQDKYGCLNPMYRHFPQEVANAVSSAENLESFIKEHKIKTVKELCGRLGYTDPSSVDRLIHRFDLWDLLDHNESTPEQEVRDFVTSLGITNIRDRQALNGKEIDIYCPDYNIGIEFNGTYWHSSIYKNRNYHFDKSRSAEDSGIHIIHIYEYEWNDKRVRPIIESILRLAFGKIERKIYARKCEIREITNDEAKNFVDENHIQGHRAAKVTIGLYFNDELVQLMSFSHNPKYEWEIIRSCPKMNTIIVGGISKLFRYFVERYSPVEIFSYADFNKFDGHGYESLGMQFIGYTGPDMKWVINDEVFARNPNRNAEFKEIADAQIFGAGSKKFLWKK